MSFENFQLPFGRTLAGLTAFTASDGPLPTGVYKMQFTGAKLVNKKKDEKSGVTPPGKNIEVSHKIVEVYVRDAEAKNINPSQFIGREVRKWIPAPGTGGINDKGQSTDETGLRQIRAMLESIGHPPEVVDTVAELQPGMLVAFGPDGQPLRDAQGQYVGRLCHWHNVETNQTQDGDSNYITPEKYELYRQGAWTPAEVGKPRQQRGGGQALPNVGTLPNTASAMSGIANPAAVGMAPSAGLANPAFAGGAGVVGPTTPLPTQPVQGNGVGVGGLIR